MWIVPVALVVLGGVAFLVLGGDGGGGLLGGGDEPDNSIPEFDFRVGDAIPVSTQLVDATELQGSADDVSTEVVQTIDTLYTHAFLDPANWREGTYDEVWPLFADGSQAAAQEQAQTVTLGSGAGELFETVGTPKGKVIVTVLLNDEGQAAYAVAQVTFSAVATRADGFLTLVKSAGQYLLRPTGEGWAIESFSVERDDRERKPKPGPTGSPTAEAS